MPYIWVPPELYVRHNGVSVYRAYRNDNLDDKYKYCYTLSAAEDGHQFDIRDLDLYKIADEKIPLDVILREAIEAGEIKACDDNGLDNQILAYGVEFDSLMESADFISVLQEEVVKNEDWQDWYTDKFKNGFILHHDFSTSDGLGAFILAVKEGFLYIPYSSYEGSYELLDFGKARLLSFEEATELKDDVMAHLETLSAVVDLLRYDYLETSVENESIVDVEYHSIWDGDIDICTSAKYNISTCQVSDIQIADVAGVHVLEREYISYRDNIIPVVKYNEKYWAIV